MKKIITCVLLSTISSIPLQSNASTSGEGSASKSTSMADVYERAKTRSSGSLSRGAALRELRARRAVSNEDYRHVKGSSASQAALVTDFHNMGITGKGVVVWLLEDSGVNSHADVETYVDPASDMAPAEGFDQKRDHGAAMASLAHQTAPGSRLIIKHASKFIAPLGDALNTDIQPHIINASFNTGSEVVQSYFGPIFKLDERYRPLVVKSAGNDAKVLGETAQYEGISNDLLNHLIIAGNLRQDGRPRASSGVPGGKKEIQDRFLWVIADDMLAAGGPTGSSGYQYITGTSGAAAILSGAAAIIKSRYPHFTMTEVAECLLESANRDLFGLFGDGYHAIHMVEGPVEVLHEPATASASAASSGGSTTGSVQTRTVHYKPAQWGKGVLNVKNALLYADLKARSPRAKPETLRRRMLGIVAEEQEEAAKLIQRWWREHKRTVPEHKKPLPMVVDPSIPDRKYPEAEGTYRGARIPEPSPREAGLAAGMTYSEGGEASAKKTPAEIRREREEAREARTSTLDHLKAGSKEVRDVLFDIKGYSYDEFMAWLKENPGILDYRASAGGGSFLEVLLDDYSTGELSGRLLAGIISPFKEENLPFIVKILNALSNLRSFMISRDVTFDFVKNIVEIKDRLPEELVSKLLGKALNSAGKEHANAYIDMYLAQGYSPEIKLDSNSGYTIMHMAAQHDRLQSVLEHYVAKGYSAEDLLMQPSNYGPRPFPMYAESLGFGKDRGEDLRVKLQPFLDMGINLTDVGFMEMGSVVGSFINIDHDIESKKFNDDYNYVEFNAMRRRFLSLKDNAFIFDLEGFDKSPEKLKRVLYGVPEPVKRHVLDNYSPAISAAGWRALIDDAWAIYNGFLETYAGTTYSYTDWDDSKKEGPVRVVGPDGTVFYFTRYDTWVVG